VGQKAWLVELHVQSFQTVISYLQRWIRVSPCASRISFKSVTSVYLKWTSWRNFAVFCMDKALRESIQNEWDFKMLKYRGWMLGEMIYGPFVLPLEKDAHIFKIFMQFSSFKVASMHFIYLYVLHKQSLRGNSAYNLIAINNWSGLIIKTCTYMKSSKRKASKCHLKFSSLMMIFMKLVYLSSVISLK